MIRFHDVSFRYAGGPEAADAVSHLTLSVGPGEFLAVVGSNGSGKSTFARLAAGLLPPNSGSVLVDGVDTRDPLFAESGRGVVGMVFQHPDDQIVATSVEDDVAFGPENLGLERAEIRSRVDRAIAATGLAGLESREPHLLSGGQKQRLAIAGALAMGPMILVLDEPTSMIDAAGRAEVLATISGVRSEGRAVVLITHDLAEIAESDRVVVFDKGRLAFDGAPEQLYSDVDRLAAWGLELPSLARVAAALRTAGAPVSRVPADPQSLVESLWPCA